LLKEYLRETEIIAEGKVVLRKMRISKLKIIDGEEEEVNFKIAEAKVFCRHCRNEFDEALDKCPKCGAISEYTPSTGPRQWTVITREKELPDVACNDDAPSEKSKLP